MPRSNRAQGTDTSTPTKIPTSHFTGGEAKRIPCDITARLKRPMFAASLLEHPSNYNGVSPTQK